MSSASPEGPDVMRVRTDLVLDQLVSRVHGRALELRSGQLDPKLEQLLDEGPEPRDLARLGYASRIAETELFEPARRPMPWLAEMVRERVESGGDRVPAIGSICRELAAQEPDDKPDPGVGSWRVPGPGGHVRHYLAQAAADDSGPETKRCFLYGFYVRCCEEAEGTSGR